MCPPSPRFFFWWGLSRLAGAIGGGEGDFRSVYGCNCCLLLGTPSQTHVGLRLCQFSGPRSAQSSGRIKLTITATVGPGGLNRTHPVGSRALGSSPKWLAEARGPSPGPPRVARPSPTPFLHNHFLHVGHRRQTRPEEMWTNRASRGASLGTGSHRPASVTDTPARDPGCPAVPSFVAAVTRVGAGQHVHAGPAWTERA